MLYRVRAGDANMRAVWSCSRNDAGAFGTFIPVAIRVGEDALHKLGDTAPCLQQRPRRSLPLRGRRNRHRGGWHRARRIAGAEND
jgi:hypothetical protein